MVEKIVVIGEKMTGLLSRRNVLYKTASYALFFSAGDFILSPVPGVCDNGQALYMDAFIECPGASRLLEESLYIFVF